MSTGYIAERLYRTEECLAEHVGSLRERLPEAYQKGIATITDREIEQLGNQDLTVSWSRFNDEMKTHRPEEGGWAHAGVEALDDHELIELVREMISLMGRINNWIEYGTKELSND